MSLICKILAKKEANMDFGPKPVVFVAHLSEKYSQNEV